MKKKVLIIISIVFVMLLLSGTYAFFSYSKVGKKENELLMGQVYFEYLDGKETIDLINVFPLTDKKAREKDNNYMTFSVKGLNTNETNDIYYVLVLI